MERDGVWHHDRIRETDVGVRGQSFAGTETPTHRALLRPNH